MSACRLPPKGDLFGVGVSITDYAQVVRTVFDALEAGRPLSLTALAVHGLMTARLDHRVRRAVNSLDIVTPDGQPVRFALNRLYDAGLADRVYGPRLTLLLCREAARRRVPVYLYGSRSHVVEGMARELVRRYPELTLAGVEPSLFRPFAPGEEDQLAQRINSSGAGLLFWGLGCPLQEMTAAAFRGRLNCAHAAVGAAFDFISGNKAWAPEVYQRHGLEWLFRFLEEPGRLWKRYLLYNSAFVMYFLAAWLHKAAAGLPGPQAG